MDNIPDPEEGAGCPSEGAQETNPTLGSGIEHAQGNTGSGIEHAHGTTGSGSEHSSAFQSCESLDNKLDESSGKSEGKMSAFQSFDSLDNLDGPDETGNDSSRIQQEVDSVDRDEPDGASFSSRSVNSLDKLQENETQDREVEKNASNGENVEGTQSESAEPEGPPSDDPNYVSDPASGNTVLHLACQDCDYKLILKLIEKGASVQRTNARDRTVLHELAIGFCNLGILDRIYEQQSFIDTLTQLVKEGVDVNDVDDQNKTALHYVVTVPRTVEVIKPLILIGTRVNAQDKLQQTAMHVAGKGTQF